ncbi:unnamed protein product [Diplocarpon coronariae]
MFAHSLTTDCRPIPQSPNPPLHLSPSPPPPCSKGRPCVAASASVVCALPYELAGGDGEGGTSPSAMVDYNNTRAGGGCWERQKNQITTAARSLSQSSRPSLALHFPAFRLPSTSGSLTGLTGGFSQAGLRSGLVLNRLPLGDPLQCHLPAAMRCAASAVHSAVVRGAAAVPSSRQSRKFHG